MPRLSLNTRKLYLLALFQLVGGPLVLLAVLLFGKLSVKQVTEHGFLAGITQTAESQEWKSAMQDLLQEAAGLPSDQKDKLPVKVKDAKQKIFAIELDRPTAIVLLETPPATPWSLSDSIVIARAHAPPIPPPRGV